MSLSLTDFNIEKHLGSGVYGDVFHAKRKNPGNDYTDCVLKRIIIKSKALEDIYNRAKNNIKRIRNRNGKFMNVKWDELPLNSKIQLKAIQREINILKDLDHPSIIKLHDWFLDKGTDNMDNSAYRSIYLVMEYAPLGDLKQFIETYPELPVDDKKNILLQILEGLNYLHQNNIMHRDLKLENILITSNEPIQIKIADFGFVKLLSNNMVRRHTQSGTPDYMHPNIFRSPYGKYVDYWSFGVIMYVLLTNEQPALVYYNRSSKSQNEIFQIISQKKEIGPPGIFLLQYLFNNRIKKYDYEQIKNHQFFKGLIKDNTTELAFKNPPITYGELYERRKTHNNYSKRSKNFNSKVYYGNKEQKLHIDANCQDNDIESNKYICRYCGYLICLTCTPRHKTILKRVKHSNPFTWFTTHNNDSRICRPCALYLGFIPLIPSGGSSKKKINKKPVIHVGPKGGKYYFKKDKNNKKTKVYIK